MNSSNLLTVAPEVRISLSRCLLLFPLIVWSCGCEKQDEIQVYSVPRHETLQSPAFLKMQASRRPQPARMLAAIVPMDSELWFFKLQGKPDEIEVHQAEYLDFMKSLKFADSTKPTWTVPNDWKELAGARGRFATLQVSQTPLLELTVTALPNTGEDLTLQILNNINRWRGQLSLSHLTQSDLPERTTKLELDKATATLIDITGRANLASAMPPRMPGGMGGAPGATLPADHPPISDQGPARQAGPTNQSPARQAGPTRSPVPQAGPTRSKLAADLSPLAFEKPEQWTEAPPKQFQLARFIVGDSEPVTEISVSKAGGDRAGNINRWRGQIGLPPASGEELNKLSKPFEVDTQSGEIVELVSDKETIIGVMIPDGPQTWFVKLRGPSEVAAKERERFEAFSKSLKLK